MKINQLVWEIAMVLLGAKRRGKMEETEIILEKNSFRCKGTKLF
jgi:hypothetical protein